MTQPVTDTSPTDPSAEPDLPAAIHRVLAASAEPLTVSKIRSSLPAACRRASQEELEDTLRRQVAAGALHQYPKYRSQQDRFWDRSMPVHVASLLRGTLQEEGAMTRSQLRRKLPAYAVGHVDAVLENLLAQGQLFRHPRSQARGGDVVGAQPPDPRDYLREELTEVFGRLQQLGFSPSQLREAAMDLLQEAEWGTLVAPPPAAAPPGATKPAPQAPPASRAGSDDEPPPQVEGQPVPDR
jgi:hypothetical protein